MKTLKESILSDIETNIEQGTNIVDKLAFLITLGNLIGINMNEYPEKWDAFIDTLNNQCKPIKTPNLVNNEVIIAYKENFEISDRFIGKKANKGIGTLLILYGKNLPYNDNNYIHINKFYKHDLYNSDPIYAMKLSTGVHQDSNNADYNKLIKTLKRMNLYKISGDVADKLIEISRYNRWHDKPYC